MNKKALLGAALAAFALNVRAATVEEVLQLHKAALGGEAVDSVRTVLVTSVLEGMELSGADITAAMKPDKFLNETHLGPMSYITGTDGAVTWQIDYNGRVSELAGKDAEMVAISAYFANYRYLEPEPGTAELAGEDETHYVIRFLAFPENPVNAYINKVTGLLDRTELEGELGTTTTAFSDYREVGGLMFPYVIEQTTGTDTITSTSEYVIVNEGVGPEAFAKPASDIKNYVFEGHKTSVTVPARFMGKAPYVGVSVLGSEPLNFLLDTGASISVLDDSTAAALGFETTGELGGTGAAGKDTASLALVPFVSIGELTIGNVMVAVLDISWISELAGEEIDGILGADFCRRFVTAIDYEDGTLSAYDPDAFEPPIDATYVPITYISGIPVVEATLDGYTGQYVIDTGNSGGIIIHKPYADELNLFERYKKRVATRSFGVGGFFTNYAVRAKKIELAHYLIENPVVELTTAEEGALAMKNVAGNIGGEVLSRFTVYLDYPNNRLGLVPNSYFGEPFPYNRAGFTVTMSADGYAVSDVTKGSPAAKAGLEPGDMVKSVNGEPVSEMNFRRFSEIVSGPAGTELTLEFERAGEAGTVTLKLAELL